MLPGYEPFLAAVCAAPSDDLPRLVLADWLDEHGDSARAEFIRLQVSAAGLPPGKDPRTERAAELWHTHRTAWKTELPKFDGVNWGEFRRGFVADVTFQRTQFYFDHCEHLLATVAPVDTVTLLGFNSRLLPRLLRHPHAGRVRHLRVNTAEFVDECLLALADADCLGGLEELTVRGGVRTTYGPRSALHTDAPLAVARSPKLARLRRLHLIGVAVSDEVAAELHRRFDGRVMLSGN